MLNDKIIKFPLNKALPLVIQNCFLQINKEQDEDEVLIPYIAGKPGLGKTKSFEKLCSKYYWEILPVHLGNKVVEEFSGIPRLETIFYCNKKIKATSWSLSDMMKELYQLSEKVIAGHEELVKNKTITQGNPVVILFFDDVHLAGNDIDPLLFELLTERKLKGHLLPDNVAIVLAGNHGINKAGARTMNAAIQNRIILMHVISDFDYWKDEFGSKYKVHSGIISFLENPIYRKFFHEDELTDEPWSSPRTWVGLSTHIRKIEFWSKKPVDSEILLYLATGSVGYEAASYFSEYYNIFSKFNIPSILNSGLNYILPSKDIEIYALSYALISYYIGYSEKKKITESVSKIIYIIGKKQPDMLIMIINELKSLEKKATTLLGEIINNLNKIDSKFVNELLTNFGILK